jgi:hypothetical protein
MEHVTSIPVSGNELISLVADEVSLFATAVDKMTARASIWTVPKSGGTARAIVLDEPDRIGGMVLIDGDLLFTTGSSVKRVPKTGGVPVVLSTATRGANRLMVVGANVYWVADGEVSPWEGGLFAAPLVGGPSRTLAGPFRGLGLHVVSDIVYAVGGGSLSVPQGVLMKVPLNGGGAAQLGTEDYGGIRALVGSGADVFTISYKGVSRVNLQTGSAIPIYPKAAGDAWSHSSMAIFGSDIYWTYAGIWGGFPHPTAGKVRRVNAASGVVTDMAVCLAKPGAIVVDATHVYWYSWLTGEMLRVPK